MSRCTNETPAHPINHSRRAAVQAGAVGLLGLGMNHLQALRGVAETGGTASDGTTAYRRKCIYIFLSGGLAQHDSFDMKPDQPDSIRGEFQPIATSVPGIEICEMLPSLARCMDKLAVVRSLHGGLNDHNVHQCLTGWETHPQQGDSQMKPGYPAGGWPSIGAVVSQLRGPVRRSVPPFISLSPPNAESTTRASLNQSGFLGIGRAGFEPPSS